MLMITYSFTDPPAFPENTETGRHMPLGSLSGSLGHSTSFENVQEHYQEVSIRRKENNSILLHRLNKQKSYFLMP